MADIDGFDATQVDPAKDFEALPPARYEVVMTESEWVDTKANDGKYLKLTFQVITGPYKDRNLWANLNLMNKSDKAVQIAKGQLSSICRAVKIHTPKDTTELHNLPLVVRVEQRKDGDKTYNDIKGFYPRDGAAAADAGPKTGPQADPKTTAAPAKGASPWGMKKAQ
jgi:hypothetical protein